MCSFQESGEFGGRKKGDVARSPPPNDHGFLLVHHPIENAGQIFTEAGVRRFTRHEAPNWYCTAFLYGIVRLTLLIPIPKPTGRFLAGSEFAGVNLRER